MNSDPFASVKAFVKRRFSLSPNTPVDDDEAAHPENEVNCFSDNLRRATKLDIQDTERYTIIWLQKQVRSSAIFFLNIYIYIYISY